MTNPHINFRTFWWSEKQAPALIKQVRLSPQMTGMVFFGRMSIFKSRSKVSLTKLSVTLQVLNPLDAICNVQRKNAICINQLKFGKKTDADVLKERPDVKIFLPFKFHIYDVNELFNPGRYQRYMGKFPSLFSLKSCEQISFIETCIKACTSYNRYRSII